MKKSKIASVVKFTVEKNIRNKWFVILNVLFLIATLVFLNFSTVKTILNQKNIAVDTTKIKVEVVDPGHFIYDALVKAFQEGELKDKVEVIPKEEVSYDVGTMDKETIIIQTNALEKEGFRAKIISKEGIDMKYYSVIQNTISSARKALLAQEYHVTPEQMEQLTKEASIERVMVGIDSKDSDSKFMMQTISNYMILVILMIILSKIANDISQEKISKSIEYVLTSVSAKDYLIAKVISINVTLILQLLFGFVYFVIGASLNSFLQMMVIQPEIGSLGSSVSLGTLAGVLDGKMLLYLGVTFGFMLITILILSVIQAALSSKTTNITEAGNATILLLTLNIFIYILSTVAISPLKETNMIIHILSCLPIVSMYFIPSMMLIGQAGMLQIIMAAFVLVGSVPFIFRLCAAIFKNGVLDYSHKKGKQKEEQKNERQVQEEYIRKKEYSNYGFVIGMSVILFVVLQFILTFILTPIAAMISQSLAISSETMTSVMNICISAISLGIPACFVMLYTGKKTKKQRVKKDAKEMVKSILIAVPLIFIVQIALGILLQKLGLDYDIVEKTDLYHATSLISNILFFVQIAILPAIFEELYLRKAVLNFSKKYGITFAIISSAILFAVVHMNISQAIFAFIMGVILAVITLHCHSVIPAMIIHLLNNGYAALTIIFEQNATALTVINGIMLLIVLIGIGVAGYEVFLHRHEIMKWWQKIRHKKENKEANQEELAMITKPTKVKQYRYIACDYAFIVSVILVSVMLLLMQKMLTIL